MTSIAPYKTLTGCRRRVYKSYGLNLISEALMQAQAASRDKRNPPTEIGDAGFLGFIVSDSHAVLL